MQGTESLGLVHWDDPERWYEEGGGRGVQDGEHVYNRGRCTLMYGKSQYNIVKKKKIFLNLFYIAFVNQGKSFCFVIAVQETGHKIR